MAQATVVFRNNAIELMRSQRILARQAAMLEEQLAQEQRLALLQRNFVSMASHEFRTPLTIIDGHAGRLSKMKISMSPDQIDERAGKIRAAVLRVTHLIDNLLNSARLIDGGASSISSRPKWTSHRCCTKSVSYIGRWCQARKSLSGSRRRCRCLLPVM